jgi:hypothetical protein
VSELDERSLTISLKFNKPGQIKVSDYLEVTLDFSSFDKNWEVYSTGTRQKEFGPVKAI